MVMVYEQLQHQHGHGFIYCVSCIFPRVLSSSSAATEAPEEGASWWVWCVNTTLRLQIIILNFPSASPLYPLRRREMLIININVISAPLPPFLPHTTSLISLSYHVVVVAQFWVDWATGIFEFVASRSIKCWPIKNTASCNFPISTSPSLSLSLCLQMRLTCNNYLATTHVLF